MENESLYAGLLRALKECDVPVMVSWARTRRELCEMTARVREFQRNGLLAFAFLALTTIFLPADFPVRLDVTARGVVLTALLVAGLLIIWRTRRITALVKESLAKSDVALGERQPAAILHFTFGGALADWVFFAAVVRGVPTWYTALVQKQFLAQAIATSLGGRKAVVVHLEAASIADAQTLTPATILPYVERAATALEAHLPGVDPAELTAIEIQLALSANRRKRKGEE